MPTPHSFVRLPNPKGEVCDLSGNHRGQRNQDSFQKKELARSIVSNFSIYCKENGEKVFAAETEPVVREKLTFAFGFLPNWATNREYGEVLNRHPVKVHDMTVTWRH